ncbi:MAPEG family protein [soil metagenome]
MSLAYWCILIAALLPIVWISYAKIGSTGDNRYPREEYDELTPPKRRAYAAHQNAYENFPFFAVAVLVATTMGAQASTVNVLAVLYILFRIAHGLLYIANKSSLRSLAYTAALVVNVAIFVLPGFK